MPRRHDGPPFRAVVDDGFYGEDAGFTAELRNLEVGYVLALRPSRVGDIKKG